MGWMYTTRPASVSQWFKDELTWETETVKNTCLKTCVRPREAYGAVEQVNKVTGDRTVWAAVFLLDYANSSGGFDFGHKDMDETVGPNADNCPESILKLLTPTEHEFANDWRRRCWEKIERKKRQPRYSVGDTLRFKQPIEFANGYVITELTCVDKCKRRFTSPVNPMVFFRPAKRCLDAQEFEVVPKIVKKTSAEHVLLPFS